MLLAYIDESGQISNSRRSSDHFVMAAIVCRDQNLPHLERLLREIKVGIGRRETDRLNWKKIKKTDQRLYVAQRIGQATFIRITAVVVCKRHLQPPMRDRDEAYLFTLRFLLERLSWLGRLNEDRTAYTLSHIKGFKRQKLRDYETALHMLGNTTQIAWDYLDFYGGRISNDKTLPFLQFADLAASAVGRAFEPNRRSPADQTYLNALLPAFYRGIPGRRNVLTSYGLKMHPWKDRAEVQALYPWVGLLR